MKLSRRTTVTFTLGLLTAVFLAGCASTPTSAPSPSVSASRQAFILLQMRTCYKNGVSQPGETIQIGTKDVSYGNSACFITDDSGTETKFYQNSERDSYFATFTASNPLMGNPRVWVHYSGEAEPAVPAKLSLNETTKREDVYNGYVYTFHRKADSTYKEFTVDITFR